MTRLPVFSKTTYDPIAIGRAIKFFPFVGLLIGLILCAVFMVINPLIDNKLIVALIIVVVEILLTGGLHLDGLSDSFDGLFSYRDKERILEIMKDSCIGVNGALALIVYVVAKILFLSELGWEYIVFIPVVARLNTVLHAGLGRYAREEGMGKSIVDETSIQGVFFAILSVLVIGFILLGLDALWLVVGALSFGFMSLYYIQKRIDGITGDTMGAVLELTSLVVLFIGVLL
ncbi:cobamide synthase CobS [Sulfurospirillum multivorans DSM 12446]|nr:cobamide synthase CobS [Sulfurospirillum multivorans DSM 12446]AOO65288.1 cobamide synthase CobS [Sulfurospirillum halorespirans DSM 13726]WNZ00333.1 Adenosylcobinamide-GDP ribazoletransferase (Cobalamin synthase) (Cobalamin-5'-phosphate synthase) [Sulfurospirillum sp. 'SP']WNZ00386.1 Adenosylcobinamide-GDP ribazoletransferase (Cobalamin synthase) (Cobalamin-5'-phosphate synthase) [Sulfurospirillum sp. 'SP']